MVKSFHRAKPKRLIKKFYSALGKAKGFNILARNRSWERFYFGDIPW
jgi:hypothetical protein